MEMPVAAVFGIYGLVHQISRGPETMWLQDFFDLMALFEFVDPEGDLGTYHRPAIKFGGRRSYGGVLVVDVHGKLVNTGIIEPGLNFIQEQIFGSLLGLSLGCPQDVNQFDHGRPPD